MKKSLSVKLSNSQLNKLKSAKKKWNWSILRLSSNIFGDNEINFLHRLLLSNRQVANLHKAFANYLSADIKLSKTQLSKIVESGGLLGRLLGPLLKTGLPSIANVIKPLAKSVLILLGLTAAVSAANAEIYKKILGSGHNTTLIISNDEITDTIKVVKSLEDSGLLLKGVTETVQNEVKEQKGRVLSILLGTSTASLLGKILTERRLKGVGKDQGINKAVEGVIRAGYGSRSSKMDF